MEDQGSDDRRSEFLAEARSLLQELKKSMAGLAQFKEGDKLDYSLMSSLRLYVHTLKGISGFGGFGNLQKISKVLQEFFDHWLRRRLKLDCQGMALIRQGVEKIEEILTKEKAEIENVAELIATIEGHINNKIVADNEPERIKAFEKLKIDQRILAALLTNEECRLFEAINSEAGIYLAFGFVELDPDQFEEQYNQFKGYLANLGEVIAMLPSPEKSTGDKMKFIVVLVSNLSLSEIAENLVETEIDIQQLKESTYSDVFFDDGIAEGF